MPKELEGEPLTQVLQITVRLCDEVSKYINGIPDASMLRNNRYIFRTFDHAIKATSPRFVPCRNAVKDQKKWLDWLEQSDKDEGAGRGDDVPPLYLEDMRQHIQR